MSLLQVTKLNKYFGATPILRDVDLEIQDGEKWGLIGRNGSGKSTLLRVITGELDYDGGAIGWAQNCRYGYLKQEPEFSSETPIYQELRLIFADLDELQSRIDDLQRRMETPGIAPDQLHDYIEEHHELTLRFESQGGYQIEGRIQGVLRGLGIPRERWNDPASSFSGGERTRLALARLLLTPTDLLLLDEPTNYLDIAAVEWLEEFLTGFKGAILLISHDRFFLDRVVSGIYEVEETHIARYRGNYTSYRVQKDSRLQAAQKAYQEQEKELQRLRKLVREASSEEKRKAHSIEKRLEKQAPLTKPTFTSKKTKLRFRGHQPSGKKVLEINGVSKCFDTKVILNNAGLTLYSGEKLALIGPNGAGKTTLLRIVLGFETADRGSVSLGYEVQPGYFQQIDPAESDSAETVFDQIIRLGDFDNTEVRTLLGQFRFCGEDVFKPVAALSGGERRRLGLLKLMLSKANFLILDEPTNHLDLELIEILEEALLDFSGTALIVSHDRYFLNKVAGRYLAIQNGELISFPSYQAYLDRLTGAATGGAADEKPKSDNQLQWERNKERQREVKRRQRGLEEAEQAIARLEARKEELQQTLNDPAVFADYIKSSAIHTELEQIEAALLHNYEAWEEHHQGLEELEG